MDALREYLAAAFPPPAVVLGQQLQPFSLGHYLRLLSTDNWFSGQSKSSEPDLGDLVQAVWICCQTWEECEAGCADPKLPEKLKIWGRSILGGRRWWSRRRGFNFFAEAEKLIRYIQAGSTCPKLTEPKGGETVGAPFIQRVLLLLQAELGHSRLEALDKPWGLAKWDYWAYWEGEGALRILDAETNPHLQMIEEMDRAIERIVARGETISVEKLSAEMYPKGEEDNGLRPESKN